MSTKHEPIKTERYGRELTKDLLLVLGTGLAAGIAIIAAADKIARKSFENFEENVEFDD